MSSPSSTLLLPSDGFRSNTDWGSGVLFDTENKIKSDFDFLQLILACKKESLSTTVRIFSIARQLGCKSVMQEKLKLSSGSTLKRALDANVENSVDGFVGSEIHRFSFFSSPRNRSPEQNDFLGYAVIKADLYGDTNQQEPQVYVFESVLRPNHSDQMCTLSIQPQYCKRSFLNCKRPYEVKIGADTFSVEGAMYTQQNGKNFCCAHVALRSVLSLLLDKDISYADIDNKIERMSSVSLDQRGLGLSADQIDEVLKKYGIVTRRLRKAQMEKMEVSSFAPFLYGFVESGCPSLVAFYPRNGKKGGHIMPVLGHTFDPDSWVPEARDRYFLNRSGYLPSAGWLGSFIIHDDNFGPYKTLSLNSFDDVKDIVIWGLHKNDRKALCFDRIEAAAMGACEDFVKQNNEKIRPGAEWYNLFLDCRKVNKLILRPLYVNKQRYIDHIQKNRDFEKAFVEKLEKRLENIDKLWMVELSCRELFSAARAKLGEVLFAVGNVDDESYDVEYAPLVLRLPGIIHFYRNDSKGHTAETPKTKLDYRTDLF